ncbi:ATPase [Candidatus Marinamargulisbacteria bacterium SCGC AAA071-K20]|nr:ATPase [Candidatus Marinamargulisbacteria bacterium SCGC AAA071-K20]
MAQRAVKEYNCKHLFSKYWNEYFKDFKYDFQAAAISDSSELEEESKNKPWLTIDKLVVKPDMLFGKRGQNKLVLVKKKTVGDIELDDVIQWVDKRSKKNVTLLDGTTGALNHFLVEPFVSHNAKDELYISATTEEEYDEIHISKYGGVNIEKHWDKTIHIKIPVNSTEEDVSSLIQNKLKDSINIPNFNTFATKFYMFFKDLHFSYLELNPIIFKGNQVYLLDSVARLDDTARFIMDKSWDHIQFSSPFGQKPLTEEEIMIKKADEASGASLKLTILNPKGRVWTLVAGGGASVVYADTISDLSGVDEMSNYGEYSGNPSTEETYTYAKTVLDLMTRTSHKENKILIIGGAIANFTDVAKTFSGIILAIKDYTEKLKEVGTHIYVRRGGPNYEEGLKNIKKACEDLDIPIFVYGPETHMTDIVRLALKR